MNGRMVRGGFCLTAAVLAVHLSPGAARAQNRVLPDTLTLDRAVSIAISRSPELGGARASAEAAGADRLAAWGEFLPQANVSLNLSRSDFTRTTFEGEEGASQTLPEPLSSGTQNANQGLQLSWTVFDRGRRFANLRQQSANVRVAQRQLDDRIAAVVAGAGRAFYEALRSQRLLELVERQITDRELELDIARRRYEIAAVERIDVLAAEANLLDAQVGLLQNRRQAESALRTLAVALGLPADAGSGTTLEDIETLPELGALQTEVLVRRAIGGDPELLQLEAQASAATAGLWSARSAYLPSITANLQWGRSESFRLGERFLQFDPDDTSRNFSISATWSLFDGFRREQQTSRASADKRRAREDLRRRRLEIERDVRGFLGEIDQLASTLSVADRSFQIAQERLTMTREMYRNGTIDFTALQQAISGVTSAERQLIDLRYNYLRAWVNLNEFGGSGA